jgi:glycosyltransferase involved in cell wall biosynthesis
MVAVSHAARRAACAREGLAPERVAVIPNAVDPSRFEPRGRRAAMRAEIGAGPADVLVGAVGNLLPVKGHATLLDALATARAAAPGRALRLAIAGAGPLGPELRARAERLGIAGRTAFLGAVSDVPALLEALDIFALPSRSEGMSNALLEAAAAGLPVVASCAGGNPEVLRDGEEALFFPAGDAPALAEAILALARDPARARALGAAAKARVRRDFSPAALAARHHALYEEVAARSPAPLPPGGGGGRKEKAQHDPPANVRTTS